MSIPMSNLDAILTGLSEKKASLKTAAPEEAGKSTPNGASSGDHGTSHPSAQVDNGTSQGGLEGARSAENAADNKSQQPLGVEVNDSPEVRPSPGGSMGVEDKEPEESGAMEGDTAGVSEMANQDTEHPSKSAASVKEAAAKLADKLEALLTPKEASAGKKAEGVEIEIESGEDEEDEEDEEEGDEEEDDDAKTAAYIDSIVEKHANHFESGYKFAYHVMNLAQAAANEKQAEGGVDPMAMAGGDPMADAGAEDPMAGMGGEGGEEELAAIAQALEEAGVTPEDLAAALSQEGGMGGEGDMGGEMGMEDPTAGLGEEDQAAALEAAMGETGTTPEELMAPETVQDEAKVASVKKAHNQKVASYKPGAEKFASIIAKTPAKAAKLAALKDQLVTELTALKKAKASA